VRLYIVRHAEPAYPRDALTARGHRQARALARRLDPPGADLGIGHVYSSPMTRALETARYTAARLGLAMEVEPWARELEDWWIPDPEAGERPAWQVDAAVLRSLRQDWDFPLGAPHLRRGFERLCSDSDALLARHGCRRDGALYRLESPPDRAIAVFCHAGLALSWLAHLLAIPLPLIWAGFSLPPASVTTIDFEELAGGGAAARCTGLGDVGLQPP
jgi:probable phosphoglycerate mutase